VLRIRQARRLSAPAAVTSGFLRLYASRHLSWLRSLCPGTVLNVQSALSGIRIGLHDFVVVVLGVICNRCLLIQNRILLMFGGYPDVLSCAHDCAPYDPLLEDFLLLYPVIGMLGGNFSPDFRISVQGKSHRLGRAAARQMACPLVGTTEPPTVTFHYTNIAFVDGSTVAGSAGTRNTCPQLQR